MKIFKSTTAILAFIMVVNALSYGTIIPLLYPYAAKFGIGPLGMSFLLTSYSLAQFIATPILGRLSDRFGRKPILTLCLFGTAASLAVFALAQSALLIFIARIIDGATGGNISVAQAIISDSTKGQERTKSFGMLGAAFGFGFLFGPVIGGAMGNYGLTTPFWFSALLALVGAFLCMFMLPETLKPSLRKAQTHEPLFKFKNLVHALFSPNTGTILFISFIAATSLNAMILGFQAYTNDVLKLNAFQIGAFFSSFGLIGMLMQMFGIGPTLKWVKSKKKILQFSLLASALSMAAAFFTQTPITFFVSMMVFAIVGAFRDPMLTGLLSERTKAEDQGGIMGINQAYVSLGQMVGPLTAGLVTTFSIHYVFLLSAAFLFAAVIATHWLFVKEKPLDL
jgi:multidrug resistance protein